MNRKSDFEPPPLYAQLTLFRWHTINKYNCKYSVKCHICNYVYTTKSIFKSQQINHFIAICNYLDELECDEMVQLRLLINIEITVNIVFRYSTKKETASSILILRFMDDNALLSKYTSCNINLFL